MTKTKKSTISKKAKRYGVIASIVLLVLILGYLIIFVFQREGSVSIISEASLERVIKISELPTVEYTYNAVATKSGEKGDEYYVAYDGHVTAGIDFNDISFEIVNESDRKRVIIHLPEVTIQDYRVDVGSLEYIFINKKADNEEIIKEAYALCKQDLRNRIAEENEVYVIAGENAKTAVKGLFEPWIIELYPEYEIVVE